ncbi:hypothetical protein LCGC14_2229530, partial [marine sediment metagenome]
HPSMLSHLPENLRTSLAGPETTASGTPGGPGQYL